MISVTECSHAPGCIDLRNDYGESFHMTAEEWASFRLAIRTGGHDGNRDGEREIPRHEYPHRGTQANG